MFAFIFSVNYAEDSVYAWDDYIAFLAADHLWKWILSNCNVVHDANDKFSFAEYTYTYGKYNSISLTIKEEGDEFVADCYELGTSYTIDSVHGLFNLIKASEHALNEYWIQEHASDEFTSSEVLCGLFGLPY